MEQRSSDYWSDGGLSSGNGFTPWPTVDGDFMIMAAVIVYRAGRLCHFHCAPARHPPTQPTPRSDGVEWSYGRLVQNCCVNPYCSCYLYFSLSAIWILHGAVDNNHRVSVIKRALCCCSPTGAHWGNGRCRTPDQQWFRERWGDV